MTKYRYFRLMLDYSNQDAAEEAACVVDLLNLEILSVVQMVGYKSFLGYGLLVKVREERAYEFSLKIKETLKRGDIKGNPYRTVGEYRNAAQCRQRIKDYTFFKV